MMKQNTAISISKAIAIILMVIGHASCPVLFGKFLYEFHMPLFFMTAGYFFSVKYLDNEAEFIKKRFKGLYIPFLKWSVFFLLIHNWMFNLGILNEKYGNETGGVTHPYNWHQLQQNIWNCVSEMGGYDVFLTGAFWFFRALLVASILYLILFKIWRSLFKRSNKINYTYIGIAVCITMLLICAWKTGEGLSVQNLIQGGYRDLIGTFFYGTGFLFRLNENKFKNKWWLTLSYFVIVFAFSYYLPAGMDWKADFNKFLCLPIPAILGFLMTYNISKWIDTQDNILRRFLIYCGNNTLSIFIFHIISFKVVSLIKIWYYNLDYLQIGSHMIIHYNSREDQFWILYTIAGIGIPLLWKYYYTKLKSRYMTVNDDINH